MKPLLYSFILNLACIYCVFPQTNPPESYPEIGWDSLKALIVYPEIGIRAGVTDSAFVTVHFDTLSNVANIDIDGVNLFYESIITAVKKTKWITRHYYYEKWLCEPAKFEVVFKLVAPYKVGH